MSGRASLGSPIPWLLGATLLCYAIGYPVALLGHSIVGWALVFLGGPLLLALGAVTIRRVHRRSRTTALSPVEEARPPC